jgi:hypothetical protein
LRECTPEQEKGAVMTDCTELRPAQVADGRDREGQEGMTRKGVPS